MSFKSPLLSFAAFPLSGNTTGDCRAALDDGKIYRWDGSAWVYQNSLINNLYYQIADPNSNLDGGESDTNYGGGIIVDGGNA